MGKKPPASAGGVRDAGLVPGWGRPQEGRHGDRLQYSRLENPTHREVWQLQPIAGKELDMTEATWHTLAVIPEENSFQDVPIVPALPALGVTVRSRNSDDCAPVATALRRTRA